MTESTENLTLEILKQIQNDIVNLNRKVDSGFRDMSQRLSSLESHTALLHGDFANVSSRLDGLNARVDGIEQRLELTDVAE